MKPVAFPEANRVLAPPPSMPDVGTLHVYADHSFCMSVWEPSAEEIVQLVSGGKIYLFVATSSGTQPPVSLQTKNPFRA